MDDLIKSAEQKEPDEVNEPAESNDATTNLTEENSSIPP